MTIPAAAPENGAPAAGTQEGRKPLRLRLADLWPRIASSVVLAAGACVTVVSGGAIFLIAWLVACLVVNLEWQRLVGGLRHVALVVPGSLAIIAAAFLANAGSCGFAVLVLGLGALVGAWLAPEGRRLWSGFGVFYAGSLFISLSVLRLSFPFGSRAMGWLFAVVWGTDVVAYFAGRLIGGPKLLPQISPAKTWAGTLCGTLLGAGCGSLFLFIAAQVTHLEAPAPAFILFLLGLVTSIMAQGGDLFESWVKRRFGAKDSGTLIPGHGGLLDRLDGFIVAAAWLAIFGVLHAAWSHYPSAAEGLFHWF